VREAGGRIIAVLAARFRDLDVAEDAFAEACARATEHWCRSGVPNDPSAWLYRTAERLALDALRRRRTRERIPLDPPPPEPTPEDIMTDDAAIIPDERLRLIFVCCHPAVAPDSRAALTLRLVCGLTTSEIARAFLVPEPTLAQRLVRVKRKIAEAGISFEVPGPDAWLERLDAVLSTLEVAYAKAHEDAAGAGAHAGYATEILELTRVLAELLPDEPEVLGFAALARYAEARRPARLDDHGAMVPISEQDPLLWRRSLIEEGESYLRRAAATGVPGPRALQAAIHSAWCSRHSANDQPPWRTILSLYDALLLYRDDCVVRLNRAVALAEVAGVDAALSEIDAMDHELFQDFQPFHAVRADLLSRAGLVSEARSAYDAAITLASGPAERRWLKRRQQRLLHP
jgi:RNA polymerase sigma-70 factor (ECF subfamily)